MLGDRITILNDGAVVTSVLRGQKKPGRDGRRISGRPSESQLARTPRPPGEPVLFAKDVNTAKLSDISIEILAGEVVGLAGLRRSPAGLRCGPRLVRRGPNRERRDLHCWDRARTATLERTGAVGVGPAPEDRKREGLALPLDVRDNATVASLWRSLASGWPSHRPKPSGTRGLIAQLGIAAHGTRQSVSTPSAAAISRRSLLAKWLGRELQAVPAG